MRTLPIKVLVLALAGCQPAKPFPSDYPYKLGLLAGKLEEPAVTLEVCNRNFPQFAINNEAAHKSLLSNISLLSKELEDRERHLSRYIPDIRKQRKDQINDHIQYSEARFKSLGEFYFKEICETYPQHTNSKNFIDDITDGISELRVLLPDYER